MLRAGIWYSSILRVWAMAIDGLNGFDLELRFGPVSIACRRSGFSDNL